VNLLRRLPLSRLLLLCGLVVALGISVTALASAVGSRPMPPNRSLADAVHAALGSPPVEGFSANVKLTNHLLEGSSLAGGGNGGEAGALASSPLLSGASGRLWIAKDGRVRLELQAEKGDSQIYYDGSTVSIYDASTNTVYRYTMPKGAGGSTPEKAGSTPDATKSHEVPSVAKIEEAIAKVKPHASLSISPGDVAGQPVYTVRATPTEGGSLIGAGELSWNAENGLPLRAAVYSSTSSSPVIELTATDEVSYSPVAASVFEFKPPAGAKIQDVKLPEKGAAKTPGQGTDSTGHPKLTHHGHGLAGVAVLEDKAAGAGQKPSSSLPEGLPKVKINGVSATELPTALGTLLSFERSGVRYVLGGFVAPSTVEAVARGL
jgi:outer membrane lipoprotein-sorting protein